ncbi:MAG TPA: permease [Bacteroidales bacterium]|nr:permease [Bacteroidales bacterium]
MDELSRIAEFIVKSFIHIWPYLLVTIPLAVVINISGISKNISGVFRKNPVTAVFLATIVGAFSPFCSCGVIPVISSLLIGGVPVAPVMSFWIASPSMDPEIFFLSSSSLGWNIAIWRLASTFIMSLSAGYITHALVLNGFLPEQGLRMKKVMITAGGNCCVEESVSAGCDCGNVKTVISLRLVMTEAMKATVMVAKFMGLAFLITALMKFYIPENIMSGITKLDPSAQVLIAALTGIPLYTTNLTALPIAGSLLDAGLSGGAALSFLIAGATTTLPAMAAVYGITSRRLFFLYISFALAGALISGFLYNLVV